MITKRSLKRYIDKCVERKVRRIFRDETSLEILTKYAQLVKNPNAKQFIINLIRKGKQISPKAGYYILQDIKNNQANNLSKVIADFRENEEGGWNNL
jgi:hypothetical protein